MLQRIGRRNRKCSKLGNVLSLLKFSQRMVSLNQLNDSTLITQISQSKIGEYFSSAQMAQSWLRTVKASVHTKKVKSWGINTPFSKISRCSVRVRPARSVSQTSQTGPLTRSDRSQVISDLMLFSLEFFSHGIVMSTFGNVKSLMLYPPL